MASRSEIIIIDGLPVLTRNKPRKLYHFRKRTKKQATENKSKISKLTNQQRVALKNYLELGADPAKRKKAGEGAGYSPGYAVEAVNKIINSPAARQPIIEALKKQGIDDDKLAKVLKDGLEAKHPFRPEQYDWHAIHKFFVEANKLKDNYPATKIQQESRSIQITIPAETLLAVKRVAEMRKEDAPPD